MQITTLVILTPPRTASLPALRALVRAARHVRSLDGFLRWQTFRAMDASNALLLVIDWASAAAAGRAEADPELRRLRHEAARQGVTAGPAEVLTASFERQLTRGAAVATLLRVGRFRVPRQNAPARDNDFALKALAAPGSTRLSGAHNAGATVGLCRIDFDTEDGIWHFLESPLRRAWTRASREAEEEETWAINLPRLQYQPAPRSRSPLRRLPEAPPAGGLNAELVFAAEDRRARLRLQGRLEAGSLRRLEQLCRVLLEPPCERLEVDVSGLAAIPPEALRMLAEVARRLKARGGQFVLIDNEQRVRRVTRSRYLEASVR